ncbi:MAG: tail fiber domain-containing protein [Saprospiraceae bacterium]|nr:tail fiber domain-containing protein [Saprospiraceae bacterium]
MKHALLLSIFSFLFVSSLAQVYPGLHVEGELVVGQEIDDLLGTRITVSDPASFSGINLGESADDRGFMIWEHDSDLLKLGTRQSATTYDYMLALKSGKLGIGTNTPGLLLDVNGKSIFRDNLHIGSTSGTNELNIFDIGGNGDAIIRAQTTGGAKEMVLGVGPSGGLFGTVSSDILSFRTTNSTRMSITATGDVGIGTTGPGEKLDVNGSALIRTDLTTNGTSNLLGRLNIGPGTGLNELNIFDFGNSGDAIIRAQTNGGAKEMVLGVSPSGGLFGTVSNDILNFRTNNTTRMSITDAGDVGIGTTSPAEKLDVHGNLLLDRGSISNGLTRTLQIQGARNGSTADYAKIDFKNIDDDGSNVEYIGARITSRNANANNAGNLEFWTRPNQALPLLKRFEINEIGQNEFHSPVRFNFGSFTDFWPAGDATYRLGKSGDRWLDVWAVNPIIQVSDAREKTSIQDLSYGLSEVMTLRPVSYKWKDRTYEDSHLGLIAQEVQPLIPEVVVDKDYEVDASTGEVTVKELERLGMRSSELIPVLIKAIQEQQELINNQSDDIAELKALVQDLISDQAVGRTIDER